MTKEPPPGRGRAPLSLEKPYELVTLNTPRRSHELARGHAAFTGKAGEPVYSGSLDLRLTTLTPVQVGLSLLGTVNHGGTSTLAALPVLIARYPGELRPGTSPASAPARQIVIPGSSFKGVVRSVAEAISYSCLIVLEKRTRGHAGPLRPCRGAEGVCPACSLFGNTGYAAHVLFSDVVFPPSCQRVIGTPLLWQPGRGSGFRNRYLFRGQLAGRKFYYHRRPARGADLRLVIREQVTARAVLSFDALSAAQLGLLCAALGNRPGRRFPLKLGGGKPVGMGSVRVELVSARLFSPSGASGRLGGRNAGELAGEALETWLQECTENAVRQGILDEQGFSQVERILSEGGLSKEAPSEPY